MQPLADVVTLRRLTGAAWDDELAARAALDAASGVVRDYCGWAITAQTDVESVVDSDGARVVVLPSLHVTAVRAVTDAVTGAPITGYRWSTNGTLVRTDGRWPAGPRAVRVRYDSGYAEPPAALGPVVCSMASRFATPTGVASVTVGAQTVTYTGDGLSRLEEVVLNRYRIVDPA
ncbi:hypothetical protein [Pseudonocardia acaciae]|uniref:hypothetical protein n=1 Tax=Pseudonocardia acaciae TaxID=551276 RepID=UPI00048EF449|nr:hypothetical protein [Pseudonocardia acaciae]